MNESKLIAFVQSSSGAQIVVGIRIDISQFIAKNARYEFITDFYFFGHRMRLCRSKMEFSLFNDGTAKQTYGRKNPLHVHFDAMKSMRSSHPTKMALVHCRFSVQVAGVQCYVTCSGSASSDAPGPCSNTIFHEIIPVSVVSRSSDRFNVVT